MAIVSSHTLNAVDGTHAGGIDVRLTQRDVAAPIFSARMDNGGRLAEEVDLRGADPGATYELVFHTEPYWRSRGLPQDEHRIIAEIVLCFFMPDPDGKYHMPIILSPNGYSTWASS